MDPFKQFSHFITCFIPGIVIAVSLGGLLSVLLDMNLLSIKLFSTTDIVPIIFFSTVFGLIADEARHVFQDKVLTQGSMEYDPIAYSSKLGIETYRQMLNDYFYFYEFDSNMTIAFLITAVAVPSYFINILHTSMFLTILFWVSLMALSRLTYYCGQHAYKQYIDVYSDLLKFNNLK